MNWYATAPMTSAATIAATQTRADQDFARVECGAIQMSVDRDWCLGRKKQPAYLLPSSLDPQCFDARPTAGTVLASGVR